MRVLLVSSFTLSDVSRTDIAPPLSLLYVAAVLRRAGHEPVLLDLTPLRPPAGADREAFYLQTIMKTFDEVRPSLVGLNCFLSVHFPFVRTVARTIKSRSPATPIAVGGIHPTLFAADIVANCRDIDYVIAGEGEEQAVRLAEAIQAGGADLSSIPSLAYRDSGGRAVLTPRTGYITDLDSLPMPAWDLVRVSDYFTDHSNWYNPKGLQIRMSAPLLTSRSCPFNCTFCSAHAMMGRGLRMHGAVRVVDEMQRLYDAYGVNYFGFVDDNLTLNKRHVLSVCNEILRRGLNIQFESFNGYNIASMDEDIVQAMCAAGCVYVIMPIEHGSDYMRNTIIGKKLPREKIYALAELYRKHDLLTRGVFIMGFPEDTPETLDETYRMMLELKLDLYNVFTLIPFPGTAIFRQAMRDRLFVNDVRAERLWEGTFELNALRDQVFIKPYRMTVDQVREYRRRFDEMRIFSERARRLQKGQS